MTNLKKITSKESNVIMYVNTITQKYYGRHTELSKYE